MIRVVTVAREFGSGGGPIAGEVARRLGWKLLDAQLIQEIANRAGVDPETVARLDERLDSPLYRMVRAIFKGAGNTGYFAAPDAPLFDGDTMIRLTSAIIANAAELGECVVVGRGGQCVLQNRADALHVFVYGPWKQRVKRVRDRFPDEPDPDALIRRRDDERSAWIHGNFGCNWCDRHLYDLMLSSRLGEEAAALCILEAVRRG